MRLPPAAYPPSGAAAPGYNIPGINLHVDPRSGRYSRYENALTPTQVATQVRHAASASERAARRRETQNRRRHFEQHDVVMNELRFAQGMNVHDWDMDTHDEL